MDKRSLGQVIGEETAYAKVNFTLDVLGKRTDGYHELCMVTQTVSLCDDISVTETGDGRIRLMSNLAYLPNDRRNLAVRAAELFFCETGLSCAGLLIRIKKRIPVCAGLGGGSADAAAILRLLNRLYGARLSGQELEQLAALIGSDVPFCVRGGTQLVEGRGERLTQMASMPSCRVVLCKPLYAVSTAQVFSLLAGAVVERRPDHAGVLRALTRGQLRDFSQRMYNVLEEVVPVARHDIAHIRGVLIDAGALGVVMSGSGPTVLGVFEEKDLPQAASCCNVLSALYADSFLTVPVAGIEI